jgi:hypothetical protein
MRSLRQLHIDLLVDKPITVTFSAFKKMLTGLPNLEALITTLPSTSDHLADYNDIHRVFQTISEFNPLLQTLELYHGHRYPVNAFNISCINLLASLKYFQRLKAQVMYSRDLIRAICYMPHIREIEIWCNEEIDGDILHEICSEDQLIFQHIQTWCIRSATGIKFTDTVMYSFRQASSLHTLYISTNGLTSEGFNAFCNDVRMQNSLKALVIYGDRCTCTHTGTGTSTGTDTGTVVANGTSEMGICFNLIVRLKS